ncbi:MAG: glycosyltransferase [Acidaminococcaceae bacterium]|nr:glycosyltransferase [Acidaminococcaceae bacterium]
MKCLFVAPGMLFGGAERVMSILANEWGKNNVETMILVTETEAISKYHLSNKITMNSCFEEKKRAKIPHLVIIKRVREICKKWQPDVVISFYNDLCALTAVAITGLNIPLIYSERNDPNRTNQRQVDRLYRKIVEHMASKIVFQTTGAQRCYSKRVQEKSTVILNPVNTNGFPIHDFLHEKLEIVSVGRLEAQKNQKLLIGAFDLIASDFPEYQLTIYGEGSLRKELEEYIKAKGLQERVFLPGNKNNIQEHIKDASLFVLSSDYEGIPNALIEAMAIGLPCVSTDCSPGGARELIEDGVNGLITPCGDANKLSDAMRMLLSNKAYAKACGIEALKIREKTDVRKISEDWLGYMLEVKECH